MTLLQLIAVLIAVESGGFDGAVGDQGKAYGPLQIHKAVVQDVNRIYGTKLRHQDMFDRVTAMATCSAYLRHWGKHYFEKTGRRPSVEVYARIWVGGPNGWKALATDPYWRKVKQRI